MDSMVERVIEAIAPLMLEAERNWNVAPFGARLDARAESAKAVARAAINAMMEPTPPMQEAMDELAGTINPVDCWYAAIEVALSDTEGR